ncbi:unnamed protein product [Closterium sp. NIES-65]|nr:unnamed protein product [Closterium sp. NIES-65]
MPARDDTMALTLKAWYVRVQCGVRRWDGMGWDGREWYFLPLFTLGVKIPAWGDAMALSLNVWYVCVQCSPIPSHGPPLAYVYRVPIPIRTTLYPSPHPSSDRNVVEWFKTTWERVQFHSSTDHHTTHIRVHPYPRGPTCTHLYHSLSLTRSNRDVVVWSNRDVVVWFKTTWERVKFHPHTDDIALPMLPYQKSLHATAERLLARLPRPLIAVHFRSEFIAFRVQEDMVSQGGKANASMVQQRLDWCVGEAERLITSVRDSLSHSSTGGNSTNPPSSSSSGGNSSTGSGSGPSVFIAADVPFNESAAPARSDSWTEMVQWYDGDSRVLKSSSAALHRLRRNVHGTVMIDEIMPEVNEFDPGVVAILDKLVCAHANVFLAGSWACGGGRGYETDIMKHRRQAGYSDDTLKRWAEEQ